MNRIRALCISLCALLLLSACANEAEIDNETAPISLSAGKPWKTEAFAESLQSYESAEKRLSKMTLVASEGENKLYFDTATCDIAYEGRGGLYFSSPWDLTLDTKSADAQKQKIASQIRLSYIDSQQSISEIFSFPECISKGQYTLERLKNGVQVNMVIGRAEQRTLLPPVMTAESFERVSASLEKRAQSRLKAFYKLYDAESSPKSQIDIIGEKYPVVYEIPIYVLKSVTDKEKSELEGYFQKSGYTFSDMEKDLETAGAKEEESVSPRFVISVRYELIDGELVTTIPTELIEYDKKNFTLLEIGVLEYFASASCTDQGYLLVPDGCGAVIGFNTSGQKLGNDIRIPVYGYDRALTYNSGYESLMTAPLPVFGIKSAQGSMLAAIDEGAAMADILVSSGGSSSGYARAGVVFSYCDYDSFEYKDVNTQYSWTLADKNCYEGIYRVSYSLLEAGAGFSEMAQYYRDRLALPKRASGRLKLVLGLYGSAAHTDDILFIPVNRQMPLTTFEDAGMMAEELLKDGIKALDIRYLGWSSDGIDGCALTSSQVQKVLGGKSGLKNLNASLKEKGVGLFLDADPVYVSSNRLFDGFTATKDTARMLDNKYAGHNEIMLSSGLLNRESFRYALKPRAMLKLFERFDESYQKLGMEGISLSSIGAQLNSDKDKKDGANRKSSEKTSVKLLAQADENYTVMTEGANSYCFQNASVLLDIPLAASGYPDADYSVPLLQMVLHGSLDYTTAAVNLSGDYRTEILKAIESGSGLYFEMAYRNAELLKTSMHTDLYSADYKTWKPKIVDCYKQLDDAIGDLVHERMTGYQHAAPGVSRVEYSNGTVIYLNYNDTDAVLDRITVPAYSYLRIEKGA